MSLESEIRNLFAAYPLANGEPYKVETTIAYARDLRRIPDAVLPDVLREAREASGRFLPTIGQIMAIYRNHRSYEDHEVPRPAWEFIGMTKEQFYANQERRWNEGRIEREALGLIDGIRQEQEGSGDGKET